MIDRFNHSTRHTRLCLILIFLQRCTLGSSFRSTTFTAVHIMEIRRARPLCLAPTEFGDPENRLVFIVDDEESIRNAIGKYLAGKQYHVLAFADAPTCLEQLSTNCVSLQPSETRAPSDHPSLPKLIISDIRMPGMDGLELLKAIRNDKDLVHVPVILLTAKGRTPDRIEGYNAGADAYIPKPFDPEELVSVMEQVMRTHDAVNRGENDPTLDVQTLKRDMEEIKTLLLEQGGGGPGMNGFLNNKDAKNEERVFLTPDERKVLALLCNGLMNKEIATSMSLSQPRVASLLTQMFRKAKVKNRTELARWAIVNGIVQL